MFFRCEIIVSGILPRGRDLYRVENGVAIQAPLLNLLNRKAGYINERLRYIASSLPRLTYTPHPRFVVDSVIQRSLLCKDGLHFSSRGSVQVVVDLEKAISTVRASLHAAQKRPVVSRPATPRPVVTPSEDTKTVSFSYRDVFLTTFQILQPVSVPLFNIDNFPALSPVSYASNILSLFTARPTVVSVTGPPRQAAVSVTGPTRPAAVYVTGSTRPIKFKGAHSILSNFYPCSIRYKGKTFPSVEHAYQYTKAVHHKDFFMARLVFTAATAWECKILVTGSPSRRVS